MARWKSLPPNMPARQTICQRDELHLDLSAYAADAMHTALCVCAGGGSELASEERAALQCLSQPHIIACNACNRCHGLLEGSVQRGMRVSETSAAGGTEGFTQNTAAPQRMQLAEPCYAFDLRTHVWDVLMCSLPGAL